MTRVFRDFHLALHNTIDNFEHLMDQIPTTELSGTVLLLRSSYITPSLGVSTSIRDEIIQSNPHDKILYNTNTCLQSRMACRPPYIRISSLPNILTMLLLWRTRWKKISMLDRHRRRVMAVLDNKCLLCGEEDESINHVLFRCKFSK